MLLLEWSNFSTGLILAKWEGFVSLRGGSQFVTLLWSSAIDGDVIESMGFTGDLGNKESFVGGLLLWSKFMLLDFVLFFVAIILLGSFICFGNDKSKGSAWSSSEEKLFGV